MEKLAASLGGGAPPDLLLADVNSPSSLLDVARCVLAVESAAGSLSAQLEQRSLPRVGLGPHGVMPWLRPVNRAIGACPPA